MVWGKSGKLILILSPYLWYFFRFDSHPVVYLSIWEMHMAHVHVMGFPINFWCQVFHSVGKYNKPMVWVKSWKLILIFFPYYAMGAFLPLDSSTLMHGILYHLGECVGFPYYQFFIVWENATKPIEWIWWTCEIGTHIFSIVGDFPHTIPILWCTSSNGKCMPWVSPFR